MLRGEGEAGIPRTNLTPILCLSLNKFQLTALTMCFSCFYLCRMYAVIHEISRSLLCCEYSEGHLYRLGKSFGLILFLWGIPDTMGTKVEEMPLMTTFSVLSYHAEMHVLRVSFGI